MERMRTLAWSIAGLTLLSVAGASAPAAPPEITGSLETVQGVRVLKLWGTPQQRGFAHGYLLGADLLTHFE
ncbi:MAG: hypothetical protein IID40_11740, partial [Planctomycetes bacterium]|nr:hypothetical protein [Planctomycetota bacterium]